MPKISELTAGTAPSGTEKIPAVQNGVTVSLTANQIAGTITGEPFVILSTGQSNFTQAPALSWEPVSNVSVWNFSGVDGNIGTAFAAPSSSTINVTHKFASDVAKANPSRQVYLINVSFSGQPISHWLSGTSAPDVYQNIVDNISLALTAAGVSTIDLFMWWQGESDTDPINSSYVSNWNTMLARFKLLSWFPEETPILIFGIPPATISGDSDYDTINDNLTSIVDADPDRRRLVYTGALPAGVWSTPNHMTAAGYFTTGAMAASAFMNGPGRGSVYGLHIHPVTGLANITGSLRVGDVTATGSRFLTIRGGQGADGGTSIGGTNNVTNTWQIGNVSAVLGGAYDATLLFYQPSSLYRFYGLTAGLLTTDANGAVSVTSATAPTFSTSATTPLVIGGTAASSSLTLESTSGTGTSDSILFKTGSQVTRGRINTAGNWVVGSTAVATNDPPKLDVNVTSTVVDGPASGVSAQFRLLNETSATNFTFQNYGSQNQFNAYLAAGTAGSPTATGTTSNILNITGNAWDGSIWGNAGGSNTAILMQTTEAQTGSAHGAKIVFIGTASGATSRTTVAHMQTGLAVGSAAADPGAGIVNVTTGYRIANAATSGNVLRGDGTNFVSSALGASDVTNIGFLAVKITGVNFNSANTDNAITITLPSGYTRYQILRILISGASASLTTATFGVFTAAAAGGTAIVASGTAITVSTASEDTANNTQSATVAVGASGSTTSLTDTSLFFRVQNPQGSAATGNVTLIIHPIS